MCQVHAARDLHLPLKCQSIGLECAQTPDTVAVHTKQSQRAQPVVKQHCNEQNMLHTALNRTCCLLHWMEHVAHCIVQNLLHNALNRTCCTMHWTGHIAHYIVQSSVEWHWQWCSAALYRMVFRCISQLALHCILYRVRIHCVMYIQWHGPALSTCDVQLRSMVFDAAL